MDNQLELELNKFPKINHIRFFVNTIKSKGSHVHKDYEFALVLNGTGEISIENKKYSAKKGDLFFICSHDIHAFNASNKKNYLSHTFLERERERDLNSDFILLLCQISNHFLINYFPDIRTTKFSSEKLNDILPLEDLSAIQDDLIDSALLYFSEPTFYQLSLVCNVSEILAILYRNLNPVIISEADIMKEKRKSDRFQRIISYIDLHYTNHIKLEDLASQEGLSVTHFSHWFSKFFGTTFQEYLNLKRLENAVRLIKDDNRSMIEISYDSGFSDPKYMTKMFIKMFNCTPKEFKKNKIYETMEFGTSHIQSGQDIESIMKDNQALETLKKYKDC